MVTVVASGFPHTSHTNVIASAIGPPFDRISSLPGNLPSRLVRNDGNPREVLAEPFDEVLDRGAGIVLEALQDGLTVVPQLPVEPAVRLEDLDLRPDDLPCHAIRLPSGSNTQPQGWTDAVHTLGHLAILSLHDSELCQDDGPRSGIVLDVHEKLRALLQHGHPIQGSDPASALPARLGQHSEEFRPRCRPESVKASTKPLARSEDVPLNPQNYTTDFDLIYRRVDT